ncbi:hypothetical protein SRABI133_02837 [Peribacillus simplex]|uniref:Uncharacterized protein n=1 Tax=Peribacillus simplex TaxID=1478 RepID=A0A9W4PHA7_9BACI|nr:hypothetical protein SRABI133_02837 [Peribacillus simplex]
MNALSFYSKMLIESSNGMFHQKNPSIINVSFFFLLYFLSFEE